METEYQVVIIGTGFGGIGMAIQLKKAGVHSFIILEKNDSLGGTWHENTYPGAACDVPSHLYSFSFEPKYDWSRKFASQPEILDYLKHCAEKYHLNSHIKFRSEVKECRFNEHTGLWQITTTTGIHSARSIISACGQLNRPSYPKIPGLDTFAGKQFHSARWDHNYDLHNKKVAVIGTGASAIQFVPEVAKVAEHVTLYQRSAPWILPKGDYAYFGFQKWLFRHLPFWQKIYRAYIYWSNEFRFLALTKDSLINSIVKSWGLRHIKKIYFRSRIDGKDHARLSGRLQPHSYFQ
jgi:cation diffusion facilitator CzcD-associated flavoprotein CzcO